MQTSTIAPASFDQVIDALKDVHDEASLWRLSDELVKIAPSGVESVEKVVAEAKRRGIPTKSANTLRLYRDVAIRFPAAERVPLVSFSAHREAIAVGDVKKARKVLEELARQHGPEGVTVTTVKKAIGVVSGKPAVKAAPGTPVHATTFADVAVDLSRGGKKFIAELDNMLGVNNVTLDGLHAGLAAVLAAVEARRSKAAQKAARDKVAAAKAGSKVTGKPVARPGSKPVSKPTSSRPAVKSTGKKVGDLRGL
jgi:hypothetical protein